MRSLEHDYLTETPISQKLLMTIRALGECRGRQVLFQRQSAEVLDTLRRAAMIRSVESSNRIEGVVVGSGRVEALVEHKSKPRDRSEAEVAGYRDVLADIHARAARMELTPELILGFHRRMLAMTGERGGAWKPKDNVILEAQPNGRRVIRFRPVSSVATPKFMERLCTLYCRMRDEGTVEPLLLIPSFILDFECIHPFTDGNGRIGRLLTLVLLYQAGYEVGRYIGLERIVEDTKETYYESLYRSSTDWHDARHDLRPWWEYFLGTLAAAYGDFEDRVGRITSARGAKRAMVRSAVRRLPARFKLADLQDMCPGVSYPTLKRALAELRRGKLARCLGKGRDAEWERIGSWSH
jgi:Fic family protein